MCTNNRLGNITVGKLLEKILVKISCIEIYWFSSSQELFLTSQEQKCWNVIYNWGTHCIYNPAAPMLFHIFFKNHSFIYKNIFKNIFMSIYLWYLLEILNSIRNIIISVPVSRLQTFQSMYRVQNERHNSCSMLYKLFRNI